MKKNKKMVLALVIVAALAMVSVAAIALHSDDSAAAPTGTYVGMSSSAPFNVVTIDETSAVNYNIQIDAAATGIYFCPIVITQNGNYSGTLTIGTLDSTVPSALVYTPYASVQLSGATSTNLTAVLITDGTTYTAFFMVGNDAANATTITVAPASADAGSQIILGNPSAATLTGMTITDVSTAIQSVQAADATSFTGTVTAGDLTVKAANIAGAVIGVSADGKGCISGEAVDGTAQVADPSDPTGATMMDVPATIEFSGTGSVQTPDAFVAAGVVYSGGNTFLVGGTNDVKITVDEGAVITIGNAYTPITVMSLMSNVTMEVSGTINVVFTAATDTTGAAAGAVAYGQINIAFGQAAVSFPSDNGVIAYGVDPASVAGVVTPAVSDVTGGSMNSANLCAAFYVTSNGTATTPATAVTYYFTTLNNAVSNSNNVFIVGSPYILTEDLTIPDGTTVTVSSGSRLQVGDDDNSAVLTVSDGAKLINNNARADPVNGIDVSNGQVVYTLTNAPAPGSANEPTADVIMTTPTNKIYTDVGTALNSLSQSGDTVLLIREATLVKDATVKSGVTLQDAPGADLIIPNDVTLTVQGTANFNNDGTLDGKITVANGGVVNVTSNVTATGAVEVQSGGVLALAGGNIDTLSTLTIFDGGSVALTNDTTGAVPVYSYLEVNDFFMLPGTGSAASLSIEKDAQVYVDNSLTVGSVPTVSANNTNTAKITGVVTLDSNAVATVYGNSTVDSTNFEATTVSSTYWIGSNVFQTVYVDGNAISLLPALYPDLSDIQVLDWNNDQMLNGIWLSYFLTNPDAPFVGDTVATSTASVHSDWTNLYAKFVPRMYDITLTYTPGVTWVVNGKQIDGSNNPQSIAWGTTVTVQALVNPGYTGTATVQKDGTSVSNPYSMTVTGNATFSIKDGSVQVAGSGSSGEKTYGGLTLIEILLIIIVIVIIIIAIIIAIRLMRS